MKSKKSNSKFGECLLCCNSNDLKESHIIPKFAYRWLKNSTGNAAIRNGLAPNKRIQDGYKDYLFCGDCENLFNTFETPFSQNVFVKLIENQQSIIKYDHYLLKFCVSISWRILAVIKRNNNLGGLTASQKNLIDDALAKWKDFLLGNATNPGKFEQHLIPFGIIQSSNGVRMPKNINCFIFMTIDFGVIVNSGELYVYGKLGPLYNIGLLSTNIHKAWKSTKVHVNKGIINGKEMTIPAPLLEDICRSSNEILNLHEKMSEEQRKKIDADLKRILNETPNSYVSAAINSFLK